MLTLCQPIFKKSDGTEMNEDEIKQYVLNGGRLLLPTDEKISNPEDNQEKKMLYVIIFLLFNGVGNKKLIIGHHLVK